MSDGIKLFRSSCEAIVVALELSDGVLETKRLRFE